MKKIISLFLVCLLLISVFSFEIVAAEKPDALVNTLYRLQSGDFTVGYFGGSVTYGSGATDHNNTSWRGITREWFKTQFPNATVNEVAAAIGDTGSIYGLYRADDQLIKEKAPDLCFIEFAINDSYDSGATVNYVSGGTIHNSYTNTEAIIQKIYASNPKSDIVLVVTGDNASLKPETTSDTPVFGTAFTALAKHYNLPIMYVGRELAKTIYAGNGNVWPSTTDDVWKKYYSDLVHPADAGYTHYANTIINYLDSQLNSGYNTTADDYADKYIPEVTYAKANSKGDLYPNADMIVNPAELQNCENNGFVYTESGINSNVKSSTYADSISFDFEGSAIGLWVSASTTAANITYSIDGGTAKPLEISSTSNNKHKIYILASGLDPAKTHNIKIVNVGTAGTVHIRQFLIAGAANGVTNPSKTMLHVQGGTNNGGAWWTELKEGGMLTAGTYVVSYNIDIYNSPSAKPSLVVAHAASVSDTAYTKITTTKTQGAPFADMYTFTITEDDLTAAQTAGKNQFRIGFTNPYNTTTAPQYYVGDLTLYKADDAEMTNLLACSNTTTTASGIWRRTDGLDAIYNGSPLLEYVAYDEAKFPTVEKSMLHAKSTWWGHTLGLRATTMPEAGVEYTLSLRWNQVAGTNSMTGYISVYADNYSNDTASTTFASSNPSTTATKMVNSSLVNGVYEYKFTVTQTQLDEATTNSRNDFFVGIPVPESRTSEGSSATEFYVADLTLYRSDDPNKTNLMVGGDKPSGTVDCQAMYGTTPSNILSGGSKYTILEYVAYDETVFPEPEKTALHISHKYWAYSMFFGMKEMPKADTDYIISYDLAYSEDTVKKFAIATTSNQVHGMYRGTAALGSGNYTQLRYYNWTSSEGNTAGLRRWRNYSPDENGGLFTFRFTQAQLDDATANNQTTFYFTISLPEGRSASGGGLYDFYIANFTVYRADDPNKTNLFIAGDTADNADWVKASSGKTLSSYSGGATTAEYVPYKDVEHLFNPKTQKTALHQKAATGQSGFLRVLETPVANQKYILTFKNRNYDKAHGMSPSIYYSAPYTSSSTKTRLLTLESQGSEDNLFTAEFEFTEDQVSSVNWIANGLYIRFSTEVYTNWYISDIRLYKEVDGEIIPVHLGTSDTATNLIYGFTCNDEGVTADGHLEYVPLGTADANGDTEIDICDLVHADDAVSESGYYASADMDYNCKLDKVDIKQIIKRLLDKT